MATIRSQTLHRLTKGFSIRESVSELTPGAELSRPQLMESLIFAGIVALGPRRSPRGRHPVRRPPSAAAGDEPTSTTINTPPPKGLLR